MAEESAALLRLLADGCRTRAASATNSGAIELLAEMALELDQRADELEATLKQGNGGKAARVARP